MIEDYLSFSSFFRLLEATRRRDKSVRKTLRSSLLIRSTVKKGPIIMMVEKTGDYGFQFKEVLIDTKNVTINNSH